MIFEQGTGQLHMRNFQLIHKNSFQFTTNVGTASVASKVDPDLDIPQTFMPSVAEPSSSIRPMMELNQIPHRLFRFALVAGILSIFTSVQTGALVGIGSGCAVQTIRDILQEHNHPHVRDPDAVLFDDRYGPDESDVLQQQSPTCKWMASLAACARSSTGRNRIQEAFKLVDHERGIYRVRFFRAVNKEDPYDLLLASDGFCEEYVLITDKVPRVPGRFKFPPKLQANLIRLVAPKCRVTADQKNVIWPLLMTKSYLAWLKVNNYVPDKKLVEKVERVSQLNIYGKQNTYAYAGYLQNYDFMLASILGEKIVTREILADDTFEDLDPLVYPVCVYPHIKPFGNPVFTDNIYANHAYSVHTVNADGVVLTNPHPTHTTRHVQLRKDQVAKHFDTVSMPARRSEKSRSLVFVSLQNKLAAILKSLLV